jgi:hypothetical protein
MAAKRDGRLYWTPTLQVRAGLMLIESVGLYGETTSEVVNHVLAEELKRLLESGLVSKDGLEAMKAVARKDLAEGPDST